jgi:hypothetical protein
MSDDISASLQIDAIIAETEGWRGITLAKLRAIITTTDPAVIEGVKWKKPSKPSGVPVWSQGGILCVADSLKNAVRLTFPKGTQLNDPEKLFNTRLDSKTVRAIDFFEGAPIDTDALQSLVREAIEERNLS